MGDISKEALAKKQKKRDKDSKDGIFKNFNIKVYDGETREIIKSSTAVPSDVKSFLSKKEVVKPPVNFFGLSELADLDPTHSSCIELKVNMVLGKGWTLINQEHRNKRLKIEDFLLNPNDNFSDTFEDVFEKFWEDYETFGNGYLEVAKIDNKIAVYHLPARDMYAVAKIKNDKRVANKVEKWVQKNPNGETVTFQSLISETELEPGKHYVVHLKRYSPKSSYYGVPKYTSSIPAIMENIYIREYGMAFFKNDAKPSIAIIMTGGSWGDKQDEALKDYLSKELKGRKKSHKVLLLHSEDSDAKVKIEELSKSMEGSFLDESDKNRDEIARVHGPVPPKLLGISSESSIGGGGESIGELKTFIETVINKRQRKAENFVNKLLMKLFNIDWNPKWKLGDIDIISAKDRAIIHGLYTKMIDKNGKPAMTVDEVRKDIDMPKEIKGELMAVDEKSPVEDSGGTNVGEDTQEKPHEVTNPDPDKNDTVGEPE